MEEDTQLEVLDRDGEFREPVIKALGIAAVGAVGGWLSVKGYEIFTGSNLDAMNEFAGTLVGSMASLLSGSIIIGRRMLRDIDAEV